MKALVVGGSNGIGLSIVENLLNCGYEQIYVVDRYILKQEYENVKFIRYNLINDDLDFLDEISDIDTLIITAGFGRVAPFESMTDIEIINSLKVNTISVMRIIRKYYSRLLSKDNFNCVVIGSIAGLVNSPLFATYSASKSAICKFIEAINIELEMRGTSNRILNVSPGVIDGTSFNGKETNLTEVDDLSKNIIERMNNKDTLYIPRYNEIYKEVIGRYIKDPVEFGIESYEHKISKSRINNTPQVKVGYLSGTFDLFHIGHLNLIKRAKEYCDYLVVGVHKDASHKGKETFILFEERMEILRNIKQVDRVIQSKLEDIDVHRDIKYDYLFVGSDYKGTDRFKRYERYFKESNVQIVYMPYTLSTSSTQLRDIIDNENNKVAFTME